MSSMRIVMLRELRAYFNSPIAYVFLLTFVGASLFTFFNVGGFFSRGVADVRGLFACVVQAFGGLDVVINNACVALRQDVTSYSPDNKYREIRARLTGSSPTTSTRMMLVTVPWTRPGPLSRGMSGSALLRTSSNEGSGA